VSSTSLKYLRLYSASVLPTSCYNCSGEETVSLAKLVPSWSLWKIVRMLTLKSSLKVTVHFLVTWFWLARPHNWNRQKWGQRNSVCSRKHISYL